jgi:hypothetical protein
VFTARYGLVKFTCDAAVLDEQALVEILACSDSSLIGQSLGDLKELTVTHIDVHTRTQHTHTHTQSGRCFLELHNISNVCPSLLHHEAAFKYCPLERRMDRACDVSTCQLETVMSCGRPFASSYGECIPQIRGVMLETGPLCVI